jgi:uncharacterized membrane protein
MQLSFSKVLDTSQEIVKKHWKPVLILFILAAVPTLLTSDIDLSVDTEQRYTTGDGLAQLITFFVGIASTQVLLKLTDGKGVTAADYLPKNLSLVVKLIGAQVLYFLGVVIGAFLFVIPGFIFALTYSQVQALIIDRDLGVMEAFKESARIMTGNRLNFFGINLVLGLLIIIGLLLLVIPGIYMSMIASVATIVMYRIVSNSGMMMNSKEKEMVA